MAHTAMTSIAYSAMQTQQSILSYVTSTSGKACSSATSYIGSVLFDFHQHARESTAPVYASTGCMSMCVGVMQRLTHDAWDQGHSRGSQHQLAAEPCQLHVDSSVHQCVPSDTPRMVMLCTQCL